jgi:hypothetical protein
MKKYAIIQNGIVVNTIEYETQPDSPIPGFDETYIAVQSDVAGPGYTYENGVFVAPPIVITPEIEELQKAQETALAVKQAALNKLMALGLTEEEALALGK